jgi:hypothetical protein
MRNFLLLLVCSLLMISSGLSAKECIKKETSNSIEKIYSVDKNFNFSSFEFVASDNFKPTCFSSLFTIKDYFNYKSKTSLFTGENWTFNNNRSNSMVCNKNRYQYLSFSNKRYLKHSYLINYSCQYHNKVGNYKKYNIPLQVRFA